MPVDAEQISEKLWSARIDRVPLEPLTQTFPQITLAEAYQISKLQYQRRLGLSGLRKVGKKIGLTSQAVQKQLGVQEPDFGYLTSDMWFQSGAQLLISERIAPKVEGEMAFFLGKDLDQGDLSFDQIVAATDYVSPCIEVIDCRIKDWKIKIEDTVADNAASAQVVVGNQKTKLTSETLAEMRLAGLALRIDGEIQSVGVGAACLDHPVWAVQWLAKKMRELGDPLRAGEWILSGAFGPVVPVLKGAEVRVEIQGFGNVECRFD